jgi:hypothetical protein
MTHLHAHRRLIYPLAIWPPDVGMQLPMPNLSLVHQAALVWGECPVTFQKLCAMPDHSGFDCSDINLISGTLIERCLK